MIPDLAVLWLSFFVLTMMSSAKALIGASSIDGGEHVPTRLQAAATMRSRAIVDRVLDRNAS